MLSQLSLFSFLEQSSGEPDAPCDYRVRRSARARRLSVSVLPSGRVEVLAPSRTSDRSIQRFVRANKDWIIQTQAAFVDRYGFRDTALPAVMDLAAIDQLAEIRYVPEPGAKLRVTGRHSVTVRGEVSDEEACRKALKRWLSRVARTAFVTRLDELCEQTGLSYQRVQVRAQRSCWGSHSSSGTISLNYCLAFLTPEQLRYVLIHELCHGRHMDHSRQFWRLVREFEPDYKRIDRSLDSAWEQLPAWLDIY